MKFLVIIIYNPKVQYEREMYNLHTKYLKNKNIMHYFVTWNQTQNDDIVVDDNVIKLKGSESFVPGIMLKTMTALKYLTINLGLDYDYLLRTNISTVINYDNLINYLNTNIQPEHEFFTFFKNVIKWTDPNAGITDVHYDTPYAQGTNIFLKRNVVDKLLADENLIDCNVIDDVSLGYTMTRLGITLHDFGKQLYSTNENNPSSNNIFFRNKRDHNRYEDVKVIKRLYSKIVI